MMNLPVSAVMLTLMLCACLFSTVGADMNGLQTLVLGGVTLACFMLLLAHGYALYQKLFRTRRA